MRPVFIDTNAYSAFKKGDPSIIEIIRQADIIAIGPIVIGELLSGFENGQKTRKNKAELKEFLDAPRVRQFPITVDTAAYYSTLYMRLRAKGRPIPTNDLWIAAQTLEQGCVLCSYDRHFQEIEGLLVGTNAVDLLL